MPLTELPLQAGDGEVVQGVSELVDGAVQPIAHYWLSVLEFAGHYFPICFCRYVGPGMVTRGAALALGCEAEEAELASDARRATIGVRSV